MRDKELIGLWSAGARYASGSPSDHVLIFRSNGSGRYEFSNWGLCSAELFQWDVPEVGLLCFVGERGFQLAEDARSVEERPSLFGNHQVSYVVAEEDTPAGKRMRVLRLHLEFPMVDCFGFVQHELVGLDQPDFKLRPGQKP